MQPLFVRLKARPVDIAQALTVNFDPDRAFAAATALASSDFYYDTDRERLVILAALSDAPGALKIDYTGGFAVVDPTVGGAEADLTSEDANMSAEAPEDLKMACIAQCIFLWDKVRTGSIGIENFEDG